MSCNHYPNSNLICTDHPQKLFKGEIALKFLSALGLNLGRVVLPKYDAKLLLKLSEKLKHTEIRKEQ